MRDHDATGGIVLATVEELEDLLRRSDDVSRQDRRRFVSGARAMRAGLLSDGVAPERVRFRALRCSCCACIEVSAFGVDGRGFRWMH